MASIIESLNNNSVSLYELGLKAGMNDARVGISRTSEMYRNHRINSSAQSFANYSLGWIHGFNSITSRVMY